MFFIQKTQDYIQTHYTHKGYLLGFLPVYAKLIQVDGDYELAERPDGMGFPQIEERNWVPRPLSYLVWLVVGAWVTSGMSVGWHVPFPLLITSEIENDYDQAA